MNKVKLIATDIDGTLVKESSPQIPEEYFELIRRLVDAGYLFFVASGRTYHGIRTMFHEVADQIGYIAENGAHVVYKGEEISITEMRKNDITDIMNEFRKNKDTCDYVISTPKGSLLETNNQDFIALMRDGYHNEYRITEDILKENAVIIKMAIFRKKSIRSLGEELIPAWNERVKVCMAGEEWVDFMDKSVDKGAALQKIQKWMNIKREETMAFGDNENDIGLIQNAGFGYAVANAIFEVKKEAGYICPSYTENGVYHVLSELLDSK